MKIQTKNGLAGNILGAARAESDSHMLSGAFVETADYHALISTKDFNFIVGRREIERRQGIYLSPFNSYG